jgi:hypothetical protein
MRHEDAALALWLATDPSSDAPQAPCWEPSTAPVPASVRQRAGAAVIALGEWLAGEPRTRAVPAGRRRSLAGPAA